MESADKPYDGFFRSVFASPQLAWELTRTVAPGLASGFTARQIHVESESPVDPEFRRSHTDLLIRLTRRKTDTFVLLLYEHKSSPDRFVSLQLLRYLGAIWQRSHRKHRLTETIAERLAGALEAALADPKARELARKVEMLYGLTHSPEDMQLMETAAGKRGYHRAQEDLMTFVEAKIQEGLQKGREEGRQEGELLGKRAALLRQISRKFGLTDPERDRILSCDDPSALDAALDEIIIADDKASVLNKLS